MFSIIEKTDSYTAWRQLIYLEKTEGNLDDAEDYAHYCINKFPNKIGVREQLISIAKERGKSYEVIDQLQDIIQMNPESPKNLERIAIINKMIDSGR